MLPGTDLEVCRLSLGGNVFGWTADAATSMRVLDAYTCAGGNFVDTADVYSDWVRGHVGGESERIIGRWLASRRNRDRVVLATKVGSRGGIDAANVKACAEASLRRLGTDYVDLLYVHADDRVTPPERTLAALEELVDAGKARYVAASNYTPERLAQTLATANRTGSPRFVALQVEHNLVERAQWDGPLGELCKHEEVAGIAYFALARGFLTGKYRPGAGATDTLRAAQDLDGSSYLEEAACLDVLAALEEIAAAHGTTIPAVAIAWLLAQPGLVAATASARRVEQLEQLLPALSLRLDVAERDRLDGKAPIDDFNASHRSTAVASHEVAQITESNRTSDPTDPTDRTGADARARPRGIREVAERAGVAISSVSRVLSGHPRVSDELHKRVMDAVAETGYRPDMLAQGLRRQKTMSVGFSASHIDNPILAETVTGAERTLRRAGYSLLVTNAEGNPATDAAHVMLLAQRRVDGLLLSLSDEQDERTRTALKALEIPFVLVDRDLPAGIDAPQVRFDHRRGMRQAAEDLWALGHRHVAIISGGPRRPARERLAGVEDVFSRDGGSLLVVSGPVTVEQGARATSEALASEPRPTALIAAGNVYTRGGLRVLREQGIVPGQDLSFIGCDNLELAQLFDPPVAVVRRDPAQMGVVAARVLLAVLGSGRPPSASELILPTEYLPRPSVAPV